MWCLFKLCIQEKGLIQLVIIVLVTNKSGQFKLDQSFQEARLVLVPGKECKKWLKKSGFLPGSELCAASRVIRLVARFKYYPKWKRIKPRASKKCPYCPKFRKIRGTEKDKKIQYGKTDTCSGDSGGPLWKWIGKQPEQKVPPHHACILFQIPKRQAISTDNGFIF